MSLQIKNSDITIFCDGCRKGDGKGGWAAIIMHDDFIKLLGGFDSNTTNNKMELQGPMVSLAAVSQIKARKLVISDSKYFVDGFNSWIHQWIRRNWTIKGKKPVKNLPQWKRLYDLKDGVKAKWCRGHNGHRENELCDNVANICCANLVMLNESFNTLEELEVYVGHFKN